MSWDVYLIKSETNQESNPDEIEKPLPIATKSEVHAWLRQNYPEADFTNPDWPVVFADNYSVEIILEKEEEQNDIMLAIRGDEAPYDLIEAMCQAFACRAVDTGTGGFLEGPETASFESWKDFRDEVQAQYEAPREGWFRRLMASLGRCFSGK